MELVVRKNELLRELQLFQGIVERKNTIPILANVLIEAKGDEVRMLATDLEVALRSRCQARRKGGALTLPAKKLYEIVRPPETDVRIEEDKNGVKVAADRFDSRMQTLPRRISRRCRSSAARRARRLPRAALKEMVSRDAVRDHRRGHALLPQRRQVRAQAEEPHARRHDGIVWRSSKCAHDVGITQELVSFFRRRRCSSSASCCSTAKAICCSRAVRITCSSKSAAAC
jgi:hypothetical protein